VTNREQYSKNTYIYGNLTYLNFNKCNLNQSTINVEVKMVKWKTELPFEILVLKNIVCAEDSWRVVIPLTRALYKRMDEQPYDIIPNNFNNNKNII